MEAKYHKNTINIIIESANKTIEFNKRNRMQEIKNSMNIIDTVILNSNKQKSKLSFKNKLGLNESFIISKNKSLKISLERLDSIFEELQNFNDLSKPLKIEMQEKIFSLGSVGLFKQDNQELPEKYIEAKEVICVKIS
jgi:hypothetical protein